MFATPQGLAVSDSRPAISVRCAVAIGLCAFAVGASVLASAHLLRQEWKVAALVVSAALTVACFRWVNARVREARTRGMLLAHSAHQRELAVVSAAFAHELRNRLGVARMNLGYLAEREIDERRQAALEDTMVAIDRTLELSADLLERTTGRGEPTPGPVVLAEVARACVYSATMVAKDRRIQLACDLDESVEVLANSLDVEYALMNLVLNAVDSSHEAGEVEVRVARVGETAVAVVRDHGPGIPDDVRPRLFEPFFTTKGSRGTGIGLPLALAIAESHGGTVRLADSNAGGSTFELALPLAVAARTPPLAKPAPAGALVSAPGVRAPGR